MNLVQYDESVLVSIEKEGRIGKFGSIFTGFKVKVNGGNSRSNAVREGCLSDLAAANQGDGGLPGQGLLNGKPFAGQCESAVTTCRRKAIT
jgi:hypothetical protein